MKLLHFTDIHLTTKGTTIGGRDPHAGFARGLSHALARHSDADALIITGDLSETGQAQDYTAVKDQIAELPMPVGLCIGNHDNRATFLEVFPDHQDENGFVQRIIPLSLGHAILLDSYAPKSHAGAFCETRAAWLSHHLNTLPGPVWLFLHHHVAPTHSPAMDEMILQDTDRFAATLKPHRDKIAHIFHGHCHMPLSGSFIGIPFTAPRGTNHAGWAEFAPGRMTYGSDLPIAYSVIFAETDHTMCHMIEFDHQDKVYEGGFPDYVEP